MFIKMRSAVSSINDYTWCRCRL